MNHPISRAQRRRNRGAAPRALAVVAAICAAFLTACGGGGSSTTINQGSDALSFVFPAPGQQDVPQGAQIVLKFPGDLSASTAQSVLLLVDADGNVIRTVASAPTSGVIALQPQSDLRPDTQYSVKATQALKVGDANFAMGTALTRFTTQPLPGNTASGGLTVVSRTPGDGSTGNDSFAFGTFNTLHLRFSEPVDPNTVVAGSSFTFKDSSGNEVPGNLYVQDRYLSFDPASDLTAGETYTVNLGSAITSTTGDALTAGANSSFQFTAEALSDTQNNLPLLTEYLTSTPAAVSASDIASLALSPLNGQPENSINLSSALVGNNQSGLQNDPQRGTVTAQLANPAVTSGNRASKFYAILPATLRAGTQFAATSLDIKLGGQVPAQLSTGGLQITLLDDANAYFLPNKLRTDGQPTAALLTLDLGITGGDVQGNGVLNQSVLNVQGVGTASFSKFQGDTYGSLVIDAVASFPLKLVNNGTAIANITLRLVVPAPNQTTQPDTTAPMLTAQSPSACQYAFGSGNGAVANSSESTCTSGGVAVNSFPVNGSPALTFSKPLDPTTLLDQAGDLQLRDASGNPVTFTARSEGSTVILHPSQPLSPSTTYTITAGTGLTDLNGNALASSQSVTFTTEPYLATSPAAAFLTALTPGLPCALSPSSGDFSSGGSTAGACAGDTPPSGTTAQDFPVFSQPANLAVRGSFSKPVAVSSLVPADGCLTAAASGASIASRGSLALEMVDGSGQCTGVVKGGIELPQPGATQTVSFRYQPTGLLTQGQRYWLVICGDSGSACPTSQRVTDVDGLTLNTDPLNGSGSNGTNAAGGPDIIMPFNAAAPSDDFFITLRTLPATDTNGNGLLDSGEHAQTDAHAVVSILGTSNDSYLAGDRPLSLAPATTSCGNAPTSVIGSTPASCVPIILYSGGEFDLTNIDIGLQSVVSSIPGINTILSGLGLSLSSIPALASTGRLLLRLQGSTDSSGVLQPQQTGYIVPECTGTLNGQSYDYKPCIAVTLNLSLNAPDTSAAITISQQSLSTTLVGPLSFQNDGLLSIDLQNSTAVNVTADALGLLPLTATINPGGLHLQLVSQPIHGN